MPDTVALFRQPARILVRLPKGIPDPALHYRRMKVSQSDDEKDVLVAYGRYKIWKAPDNRVRWAEINWPDDGLGIIGHGAAKTVLDAIKRCNEHQRRRAEAVRQATS